MASTKKSPKGKTLAQKAFRAARNEGCLDPIPNWYRRGCLGRLPTAADDKARIHATIDELVRMLKAHKAKLGK